MYDGYNQLRRMAESYRSLYDKLDVTRSLYDKLDSIRSLYDKLDSTARVARLAENNFTSQLTHLHESLRFQLDSYLPARNLFDQLRIERGLLDDSLQRAYRPEFVARVDGMLAGIERGTSLAESFAEAGRLSATNLAAVNDSYSQLMALQKSMVAPLAGIQRGVTRLAESFAEASRLSTANLAAVDNSYSQLMALQKSVAAPWTDLASRLDQLKPLLSAQSNWARTVRFPSVIEDAHRFANQAATLFKEISALHSSWEPLSGDLEGAGREEQTEQAIALANERLAAAFTEKSPTATMQRLGEVLAYLKSGTLRLAPYAKKFLIELLIHLIAIFIFDYYKEVRSPEPPRVSKEVRREVRKIQKEGVPLPRRLRVVIATELMVRRGPGLSNPVVGRLYAGDLITWIRTRSRSWSLVEFQDEDGDVVLRGWVFSRYIRSPRGCAYRTCRSR